MKRDKTRTFKIVQIIILILLFLANMNVANLFVYFLFIAGAIGVFMNMSQLRVNGMVVVLLLFSLCYLLFYPNATATLTTVLKQFLYPLCYLIGLNFIREEDTLSNSLVEKQISIAISVCAMGAFAHYLLNMSINFTSLQRNNEDFWTGEIVSATGQAALAVLALGVFGAWLFDSKKKKIIAVVGLIFIMAYNLVLAGRTLIFMTATILVVAFLFAIRMVRSKNKRRTFTVLLIFMVIMLVAYAQNWFGVRELILGSNLSARFDMIDIGEDTRINNKLNFLSILLDYPFGGGMIRTEIGSYAHELYLDVYSDAGIFAFLLVTAFAIDAFLTALKVVRKGRVSDDFRLLILCLYLAVFAEFFLEPIIQGMPWMFCTFCFFSGLLKNIRTGKQGKRIGGTA